MKLRSQNNGFEHKFSLFLLIFGALNFLWFLIRTGFKPSRILYPCQQTALKNIELSLNVLFPSLSFSLIGARFQHVISGGKKIVSVFLLLNVIGGLLVYFIPLSNQEVPLQINSATATMNPISDIFVLNGRPIAHIPQLLSMMASQDLFFYRSDTVGELQSPTGLIDANDIIILKINCQWSHRGGTNTDLLKEVIEAILNHPDTFKGEILVADNGQGRGSMDWTVANAEDQTQSTQDIVDSFASTACVSTYLWDNIRSFTVDEYSEGDTRSGYVVYDTPDLETEIYVSYPKFETKYGTKISFKYGIWNGSAYESRLKVINLPILKTHSGFGVTGCMKHYMGVQSQGVANGHQKIGAGGMGTLMAEFGLPTLNILDAIWVNAHPAPSVGVGPSTSNTDATRVNILMAGQDPVALDYWAAKYVLMQAANLTNQKNIESIDPDFSEKGPLEEAFGVWLNRSRDELLRSNINVTSNQQQMTIHGETQIVVETASTNPYIWIGACAGGLAILGLGGILYWKRTLIQSKLSIWKKLHKLPQK